MARPEIPIDWDLVDELIEQQNTAEEIAGEFNISLVRFYQRVNEKYNESFHNYKISIQSKGKGKLRRKQWEKAMDGNVPLLLKLGELYLNQEQKSIQDLNVNVIQYDKPFIEQVKATFSEQEPIIQ